MPRHVHADLMIAYANDASLKFEYYSNFLERWLTSEVPTFNQNIKYRIKPKPDYEYLLKIETWNHCQGEQACFHIKVLYDGQTGEVKSVELMK